MIGATTSLLGRLPAAAMGVGDLRRPAASCTGGTPCRSAGRRPGRRRAAGERAVAVGVGRRTTAPGSVAAAWSSTTTGTARRGPTGWRPVRVLRARRGRAARHVGRHGACGPPAAPTTGATRCSSPEGRWAEPQLGAPVVDEPALPVPVPGRAGAGRQRRVDRSGPRACDELVELAGGKRPAQSSRTLAERPVVQADVARAEVAFRSARAFVARAGRRGVGARPSRVALGTTERRRSPAGRHQRHAAGPRRPSDLMYDAAGGSRRCTGPARSSGCSGTCTWRPSTRMVVAPHARGARPGGPRAADRRRRAY